MVRSSIDGGAVPLDVAVAEAARLMAGSRCPVIGGLGADVAGTRAVIGLADRVGAAVDHMHSAAVLRGIDVLREHGLMLTTPGEARRRGDVVLLVGRGLVEAGLRDVWPDLGKAPVAPGAGAGSQRRILWLCPGREQHGLGLPIEALGDDETSAELLGAVRARVNGRPTALSGAALAAVDALAAALLSAKFGVAVWSEAHLDALVLEMLAGLVRDLNAKTRFTGLSLAAGDNAAGVLQVCGWMSGFPMRTGFARGFPEHDPWRFDAGRLIASGEADCALWISAYRPQPPPWATDIPLIALTTPDTPFGRQPRVHIPVGRPGIDHDAVEHSARTGTLAAASAANASDALTVAAAIARIAAALDDIRLTP